MLKYIENENHYTDVLCLANQVQSHLWIGTADIKDVYVKKTEKTTMPFLGVLNSLIQRKISVRLIHAKEPGTNFRNDFDKYPSLWKNLERVLCPRVHFKIMIFDLKTVYIGSANLTGAGIGMKAKNNRNFETGILTDDIQIVEKAIAQFDNIWIGAYCKTCGRKAFCSDKIR